MKNILPKLAIIAFSVAVAAELLLNIPSHSECGTAGIDFMPCGYLDRLGWNLSNGSWILSVVLSVILTTATWLIYAKLFRKSKSHQNSFGFVDSASPRLRVLRKP